MGRMLYRRGEPAAGQKVFLAVAAYEGVSAGFAYALYHTGIALAVAGIESELAIYSGNCHVDDSRNRLTRDFLNSDCTDLVFLDADIGWHAKDLVRLLGYDRDVVAGIYPKKHGDDTYPVKLRPGEIWSDGDGLIEVEAVPTGFLRVRRQAMLAVAREATTFNSRNDAASAIPLIFERQIHDGERWGGDYVFCRKWRAMGGKIYIAPDMRFEHSGEHQWHGSAGAWMKQRAGLGLVDALRAIAAGREEIEGISELFDAWSNPYAASPVTLLALAAVARRADGPILECGSGLSTLVMGAAAPHLAVHALEDSPVFAEHVRLQAERHGLDNINVHCRPISGTWYDMDGLPAGGWGLVFIDGPRRTIGGRAAAFTHLVLDGAIVVVDDVQDEGGLPELRRELEKTHVVRVVDAGRRKFALGVPKVAVALAAE